MSTNFDKAMQRELKATEAELDHKLNSPDSPSYTPAELGRIVSSAILDAQLRASTDSQ
ncbi:hypothetical protein [Streptomyces antibioticus]|uniref:Uncharacterized protein n=1 Tax=Streptomyces antibioticus TaxID=1890 RepID=A0AAE6YCX2_STRAT|nr:hypothetical protein [Streptomyces antibioticus]QIT47613.1 hypothetical protein HCX60_32165 [Streptomyces antibioticus]